MEDFSSFFCCWERLFFPSLKAPRTPAFLPSLWNSLDPPLPYWQKAEVCSSFLTPLSWFLSWTSPPPPAQRASFIAQVYESIFSLPSALLSMVPPALRQVLIPTGLVGVQRSLDYDSCRTPALIGLGGVFVVLTTPLSLINSFANQFCFVFPLTASLGFSRGSAVACFLHLRPRLFLFRSMVGGGTLLVHL